jgi:hypothetical protein
LAIRKVPAAAPPMIISSNGSECRTMASLPPASM